MPCVLAGTFPLTPPGPLTSAVSSRPREPGKSRRGLALSFPDVLGSLEIMLCLVQVASSARCSRLPSFRPNASCGGRSSTSLRSATTASLSTASRFGGPTRSQRRTVGGDERVAQNGRPFACSGRERHLEVGRKKGRVKRKRRGSGVRSFLSFPSLALSLLRLQVYR